jgi:hypothetical protein
MSTKSSRQISPEDFSADREIFFQALKKIAGPNSVDCGVGNLAVPCIRKSWEEHRAFTATRSEDRTYCPSLSGYAGDAEGRVYRVTSCPDRDHTKRKVLVPFVEQCPDYSPPTSQLGDGLCNVLDSV